MNLSITAKKYDQVKADPDFIAAVRLGRVVNALSFSVHLLLSDTSFSSKSPAALRNQVRSLLVAAGYVHESIAVFYSLRSQYKNFDFFSKINALLYPKDGDRAKLIRIIRDGGAFHLDSEDKITSKTLLKMDGEGYEIFSGESDSAFDYYFNFADIVELNHYLWQMNDELTLDERQEEMFLAINALAKDAFIAAHDCLAGLLLKMPFGFKPRDGFGG